MPPPQPLPCHPNGDITPPPHSRHRRERLRGWERGGTGLASPRSTAAALCEAQPPPSPPPSPLPPEPSAHTPPHTPCTRRRPRPSPAAPPSRTPKQPRRVAKRALCGQRLPTSSGAACEQLGPLGARSSGSIPDGIPDGSRLSACQQQQPARRPGCKCLRRLSPPAPPPARRLRPPLTRRQRVCHGEQRASHPPSSRSQRPQTTLACAHRWPPRSSTR